MEILVIALVIILACIGLGMSGPASAPAGEPAAITLNSQQHPASAWRVIDGDTIVAPWGMKYRLLGFDTPETYQAKCADERVMGLRAKARLEALLNSGERVEIGNVRAKPDRYDRTLASLFVGGRDVKDIMISEGLARPYGGEKRVGWC